MAGRHAVFCLSAGSSSQLKRWLAGVTSLMNRVVPLLLSCGLLPRLLLCAWPTTATGVSRRERTAQRVCSLPARAILRVTFVSSPLPGNGETSSRSPNEEQTEIILGRAPFSSQP